MMSYKRGDKNGKYALFIKHTCLWDKKISKTRFGLTFIKRPLIRILTLINTGSKRSMGKMAVENPPSSQL